jgi:hypothetical protein
MPHPTRLIRHGDNEAEVDDDLAPLVLALWRAGIETASACQDESESAAEVGETTTADHRGRAYVEFVSLDHALRFLDVAASGAPENLYARIGNHAAPGAWEARLTVYDTRITSGSGDLSAPPRFAAGVVRVRFPRSDIAELITRIASGG